MGWGLFCQIEVIILTVGLVCFFILSVYFTMKDNSWVKRIGAFGEAFKAFSNEIAKSNNESKARMLNDLVDSIKQAKKE